jgi:hypothetical protein
VLSGEATNTNFIVFGLTEPSIGASHQISVHLGKAVSDKKIFRN